VLSAISLIIRHSNVQMASSQQDWDSPPNITSVQKHSSHKQSSAFLSSPDWLHNAFAFM